jgi:hypothetical protein
MMLPLKPETLPPIVYVGAILSIITVILEVAKLPAASSATAKRVCEAFVTDVEFHVIEYGFVDPDEPIAVESA